MKTKPTLIISFFLPAALCSAMALADTNDRPEMKRDTTHVIVPHDPDNTGKNYRDSHDPNAVTADDQGSTKSETELAANIRRAIVKDDSLSTYAHNVKIIVANNKVTLRGPVKTEYERTDIVGKAKTLSKSHTVVDELEVMKK